MIHITRIAFGRESVSDTDQILCYGKNSEVLLDRIGKIEEYYTE